MGLMKAVVETPSIPGEDPQLEEIELPPQDKWAELMAGTAAEKVANVNAVTVPAVPVVEPDKPEVAVLEFVANKKVIPLAWPFLWEGKEVSEITIRRLTLGEVQEIVSKPAGQKLLMYDLYAIMSGLPAKVLRGLDDDDGRTVTDAAYDFLPRSLRMEDD